MKHNIRTLAVFLIFITGIFHSCDENPANIEKDYIEKLLKEMDIDEEIKWVVILPGLGCHGCIQEGELFLKEYLDNEKMLLILTNFESLKILQNKLGVKISENSNIYVDRDDKFILPTNSKVYPCVIYLKQGKYQSHEFQAPGNNAFEKLATYILTE